MIDFNLSSPTAGNGSAPVLQGKLLPLPVLFAVAEPCDVKLEPCWVMNLKKKRRPQKTNGLC